MKKEEEPPKGAPAYMLTYGDMMSLLLTFFILLVSMSTMEVEKYKAAAASLKGAFSVLPFQKNVKPAPFEPKTTQSQKARAEKSPRSKAMEELKQLIRQNEMQNVIRISETSQGIHITIGDPALFDTGKADIKRDFLPILNLILEVINTGNEFIRVEGHTDNVPIHNVQYEDNWELSIARALSIIQYFRKQQDIDPRRLRPVGCSEFHPVASNDTDEGRALNRRVEIFIESGS